MKWRMTRLMFCVSFVVLLTVGVLSQTQYLVEKEKALKDSALDGHAFRNQTVKTVAECFLSCIENCLCMAFQIYNTTVCQLLSSNRFQTPSALSSLPGCTYYDMLPTQLHQLPTCSPGFMCCNQLNPCLNDGTCEDDTPTKTERFKCNCRPGYTGNRCQYPIKSCRSYANGDRVAGKFKVLDNNMKPFEVFCDFDENSSMTWTLVQSYQLKHENEIIPYFSDKPINEDSPAFDLYRLSKSRMESIQQDSSTKWRITCQYDTSGLVYTDYVRGSNDEINILTESQGFTGCMRVEYIDVRGHSCENCSAYLAQSVNYELHTDSYWTSRHACEFRPKGGLLCGKYGEDNFGNYFCTNSAHRCSASPTSTTQTWFGGH